MPTFGIMVNTHMSTILDLLSNNGLLTERKGIFDPTLNTI